MNPIPPLRRLLLLGVLTASAMVRADYPIVSQRYLADPGALVFNGTVYLYCSNDDENPVGGGYVMKSLVCVSSTDLKNWTDHGVVFRVPDNATWAGYSWAPAAIERNGRFYLYFANNASGIGVASAPTPLGPFTDAKGSSLINASTPGAAGPSIWLFDPSVFIDDDGQAYLYFGGNGITNARVIRLNEDMISTSGTAATISTPNFFEDSWAFKRNGLYYFSYSSNPSSGLTIDYMTSSDPMAGFVYRGTIAGQPPSNNNNNHHAIFTLGGRWYHAYHNRSVATQAGIPTTYRRNLGLEELTFNADGTIQPVTYTTDGVTQLAHVNPYVREEAEMMNAQSGISTETCSAGGMDVRYAQDGAWTRIRGVDFGTVGAAGFRASLATATAGGNIELRLDSATGTRIGTCTATGTGGDQSWISASCTVSGATGVHDLYLVYRGAASTGANLDWWQFVPAAPVILTQPADKAVFPGSPLSLGVVSTDSGDTVQWYRNGTAIAGQTQPTLWLGSTSSSDAGTYTATLANATGTTTTRGAVVSVSPDASRLINMSCRIQLNAGQLVSPGFYIAGTGRKQVLIRAAGPALTDFGVPNAMADPQLRLFHGSDVIGQDDNWDATAIGDAFSRVGAFGFAAGSRDAALLATLDAGQTYTVQVGGAGTSSGIVLVEVYDADTGTPTSRLANVSVRGTPGTDAAKLVLGFVLRGTGTRSLLIRAAGPALSAYQVDDPLPDPQLTVYDAASQPQLSNDGWMLAPSPADLVSAAGKVGAFAFPTGSRDAATLATLPSSAYTVQVMSASGAPGEALAEVYDVP
ncbi:MAG TPA: family 43 glycosylhydrolase [Opitutaceae bacterium]|nr:family 43 glycosylhydrolase [Opitutaceae bacterium]